MSHGREILQGRSNHRYIEADLLDPDPLFDAAAQFLGRGHHMVIGFIGVSYLLPDSAVQQLARLGHELSGPGSALAMTFIDHRSGVERPGPAALDDTLAKIEQLARVQVHLRSPAQIEALIRPWRIVEQNRLDDGLDTEQPAELGHQNNTTLNLEFHGLIAER